MFLKSTPNCLWNKKGHTGETDLSDHGNGEDVAIPPYQIFRLRFHRFRNRFGWIVGIYDVFNRWHKTRFVHVPSIIIVSVHRDVSGIFGPHEVGDIGRPTTGTGIVMTREQTIIVFMVIEVLTFRHFFHSIPPLRSIPPWCNDTMKMFLKTMPK